MQGVANEIQIGQGRASGSSGNAPTMLAVVTEDGGACMQTL